jgi:SPP1 family predicted phage head-tail adaptor
MPIPNLNRRIQIQTPATAQDSFGQQMQSGWTTAYTCWAAIDVQASQLLYSTAEFIDKVTHRITCRWTSSFIFSANQRIVYTEGTTDVVHTYEIQAVLNDKQGNRMLILMCYELEAKE